MNRIQFRHRPAVNARPTDDELFVRFRVGWRSHGLVGISTNDADEAEAWRRDRRAEGRTVVECDAGSRQSPPTHRSMRERLALAIEDGRGDFSLIERACIANALRSRRARQKPKPAAVLSPRLLATAKAVKEGSLRLELCPISLKDRALVRRFLRDQVVIDGVKRQDSTR
jgi:hypothetical protein